MVLPTLLAAEPATTPRLVTFAINAGQLHEALREFGEQAGLQLLYGQNLVAEKRTAAVVGAMTPPQALAQLLAGTGLVGRFFNGRYVAIIDSVTLPPPAATSAPAPPPVGDVTVLADVEVTAQQPWWDNATGSDVSGFAKPLLETPRSVSHINGEAIDLFSLSVVEDLLRVVPGVFTTTRFGVQGSVDIRNIPADTYFRGMKRLTLQGHGRSVLAAMDSIEVVGGPASPLHGIGKIGGYVNMVPKSGRSRTGQYLAKPSGFLQMIGGEYDRREVSAGVGGPLALAPFNPRGGYYLYGLLEDSGSYASGVPVQQKLLQAAASLDDIAGPLRLESGFSYQESRTAGALTGRLTQELVDRGLYIGGSPLVNLDLNGNGTIGYREMHAAAPATGPLTSGNQPLHQVFPWPLDSAGAPLPLEQFPRITGIPRSLYDYLQASPAADPTGLLRAQGPGGPLPVSGAVQAGMALDPRSVRINPYNPRRSAAFEKDLEADFLTLFADLVRDQNPDFTLKNQLFFDRMDQYKSSNQPFSQIQEVTVLEDKLTMTRRSEHLPARLRVNQALSFNVRNTVSRVHMTLGDYGNHRTDATAALWNEDTAGMTPNTTFTSANENTDLANDGLPWVALSRTEYSEMGVGLLFDVDVGDSNWLFGGRYDGSSAQNINYAGRYLPNTGTSANPGAYAAENERARGWDSAFSWSASLSHQLPLGLRPYATFTRAGVLLDGNNNSLPNDVIQAGHIGTAELREVGLKGAWLDQRLNLTAAAYQQGRVGVSTADPDSIVNAYATSTTTRGWQAELKWAPRRNFLLSLYALRQITRYTPNQGDAIQLDARALGFVDVVDEAGQVIYPAEAFLYGGRARIQLPDGMAQYERKQGNPEKQLGFTAIYQFDRHWGATLKGNYLSSTCSGRLCLVRLPQSLVFDLGIFWTSPRVDVKLDLANITDEHYFRARTGETLGDVIAQTMPGRHMQVTGSLKF